MEAMRATIRTEIEALEALFDRLNDQFFGGELERPIITVAPGIRVKGGINYGWCTSWRAWHDGDEADCDEADGYYEINISAETLQRPVLDTVDTMTHEMVHLFNLLMGVKDTSRAGTYHNRRFKKRPRRMVWLSPIRRSTDGTTPLRVRSSPRSPSLSWSKATSTCC